MQYNYDRPEYKPVCFFVGYVRRAAAVPARAGIRRAMDNEQRIS